MISIRDVSKVYGVGDERVVALKNIHLDVKEGEIYGIIGRSGAGKSSLLRCINRLENPSEGSVSVNNRNLSVMNAVELRRARQHIGMIFQHFNLMDSRTVYDNICLPLELAGLSAAAQRSRVEYLLELTELSSHQNHYPHQLSGGQKQRVAIARALANKPQVLLCDEATSALDPRSTGAILDLLRTINAELGLTIVLITHEMDVVKAICSQVAILHQGEIIERGSVLDIFTQPQTQVARDFVKVSSRMEIPRAIRRNLQTKPADDRSTIIRVTYRGDATSQPLMGFLIKQYRLSVNIIQANIESIQDATVGLMIVELDGEPINLQKGLTFLERNDLHVEVLGYAQRNTKSTG